MSIIVPILHKDNITSERFSVSFSWSHSSEATTNMKVLSEEGEEERTSNSWKQ